MPSFMILSWLLLCFLLYIFGSDADDEWSEQYVLHSASLTEVVVATAAAKTNDNDWV